MKLARLSYSLVVYAAFLGIFIYLVLFIGATPLAELLPDLHALKSVDSGQAILSIPGIPAVVNNIILCLAFAIQHSVMARKEFKALITRFVPDDMERSTYVLLTCLVLHWMYLAWIPMPTPIWWADGAVFRALTGLFLAGAGLVLWSTFMISHWQLFGLSQAWHRFRETSPAQEDFREPAMYKYSRHPLYLGILVVLWATPTMTAGHLLLAAIWSVYIFVGIGYEERDLLERFGDSYRDYMERVPQLLPLGRRRSPAQPNYVDANNESSVKLVP